MRARRRERSGPGRALEIRRGSPCRARRRHNGSTMAVLSSDEIIALFLAVGVVLSAARLLGEIAQRLRQPSVVGEILAGLLLGPTVLGRIAPGWTEFLFPPEGGIALVLDGLTTLSLVLFLLVAGIEVDLSTVWRQGKTAVGVSLSGILFPFLIGFASAWFFSPFLGRAAGVEPLVFALFFGTALSISALPVIAKTLMDLNLYRSDLGMIVIAAAIFNDLLGWLIFSVTLGMIGTRGGPGVGILYAAALAVGFAAFMLTIGRWLLHRILPWLQTRAGGAGSVLGFTLSMALLCGAFTEWFGVHALFGSFLLGAAIGDSVHLREHTRETIKQFVYSFFAPLFFASIGFRVNFAAHFDWTLTLVVLIIACLGKIFGCRLGARWTGVPPRESWAASFAMNARGAMEIVLGLLALRYGVIDEGLFVSLVVMALVTSMASGPAIQAILRQRVPPRFVQYLHRRAFVPRLRARDRWEAIRELSQALAGVAGIRAEAIAEAVTARERILPTGLSNGVAVPHARLERLSRPVIGLGFSPAGIDFDASDGEASHVIFLVLVPRLDDGAALLIFADLTKSFQDPEMTRRALQAGDFNALLAMFNAPRAA
ncbi:MAG: cation:proton antiporter [bacterium]